MNTELQKEEYKGFQFTREIPGWDESVCMMYVDGIARYSFSTVIEFKSFVDKCDAQLNISLADFFAHIKGCGRCRRTYQGIKHDPCKTGIPKFVDGKKITVHIIDSLLAAWGLQKTT